jgi:hypothetical protein
MRKVRNIITLIALIGIASSCQKEEFSEEFDRLDATSEMKSGGVELIDNFNGTAADADSSNVLDIDIKLVKEVSDGDDESDSGDDSKTTN